MKNFKPLAICWEITPFCNYNCPFCYAKKEKINTLSLDKQKKIINLLHKQGVKYISFTGGEPLLVNTLEKLIIYSKKLGFTTELCTNGSLLSKKFIKKVQNNLDMISLPLDGSNNKIINKIRNEKYHFSKFIKTIDLLSDMHIEVRINTLVTQHNKNDLIRIYGILKNYPNIKIWKLLRYYYLDSENEMYSLTKKEYYSVVSDILKLDAPFEIKTRQQQKNYQESFILLDAEGGVYITAEHKHHILGNIFKDKLENILSKSKYFSKNFHMKKYAKYS
jgi:radical S-adenosyl methionine domain-containing protein 2